MRPNRVQPSICRNVITAGPRDLDQLQAELAPFVALYRSLLRHVDREAALAIMRRAIIESGMVSHSDDAVQPAQPQSGPQPLTLTSPPPQGASFTPAELAEGFALAMASFSCEGELLAYDHEFVRFTITNCNWCRALERLDAPELITYVCETDEHFMDGHPTHRLYRPTALGRGDTCCDFQFVRRDQEAKNK
jgi:L-2-amino-thiazoline-4-carboxylic acid hydrolase